MILTHLKQESTWRGLIAVLMAVGVQIAPDLQEMIISFGLSAIGMINILKNK
jgi:hypothetical protein